MKGTCHDWMDDDLGVPLWLKKHPTAWNSPPVRIIRAPSTQAGARSWGRCRSWDRNKLSTATSGMNLGTHGALMGHSSGTWKAWKWASNMVKTSKKHEGSWWYRMWMAYINGNMRHEMSWDIKNGWIEYTIWKFRLESAHQKVQVELTRTANSSTGTWISPRVRLSLGHETEQLAGIRLGRSHTYKWRFIGAFFGCQLVTSTVLIWDCIWGHVLQRRYGICNWPMRGYIVLMGFPTQRCDWGKSPNT